MNDRGSFLRRTKRWSLLGAGSVALATSCVVNAPDEVPKKLESCPATQCLQDPFAHCITLTGCTSSSDCPVGTRCVNSTVVQLTNDSTATTAGANSCRALTAALDGTSALMSGFHVPELIMHRDSADWEPAVFSMEVPSETREMHCAVFISRPEFEREQTVDGWPRMGIANYDRSVFAEDTPSVSFDASDGARASFVLARAAEHRPLVPYTCGGVKAESPYNLRPSDVPVVSELTAGCWAIGTTHVIRASRLFPLTFSQVPLRKEKRSCATPIPTAPGGSGGQGGAAGSFAGQVGADGGGEEGDAPGPNIGCGEIFSSFGTSSCDSFTEGFNCFPTAEDGFGVCLAGRCTARCTNYDDCRTVGLSASCCLLMENRLLGACGSVDEMRAVGMRADCRSPMTTTLDRSGDRVPP